MISGMLVASLPGFGLFSDLGRSWGGLGEVLGVLEKIFDVLGRSWKGPGKGLGGPGKS